jgi:hypothetical protein
MVADWQEGYWDYNLDDSCADYGGCTYQPLCLVQDPDRWAVAEYELRRWNPVVGKEEALS